MPQKKKLESIALLGLVAQLVFLAISFALYSQSGRSPAVLAETWFLLPGVFVWLVVLLHGRQRRLARAEREEMEELKKSRISEEIFEEQELDRMRAHTGLRIFERYLVPAFSIILAGGLGFLSFWNIRSLVMLEEVAAAQNPLAIVAGSAVITFFGFLLGKFAVGLAHSRELRLLRAGGSYLMGNVVGSMILLLAMSMVHFGVLWVEVVAAYVIPIFMGLVSVEIILNLVLEIYRPRVPGQEPRPAYDSRLLNLLAEPGDILQTVAATLDYQFGFKISETWFYRFMERAIVPLILIQVLLLWLLSGIVVVDPGEGVFIERFGDPLVSAADQSAGLKATLYEPGYHLKWPWPIDQTQRIAVDKVYSREIGKVPVTAADQFQPPDEEIQPMTDENIILWKEVHVEDPQKMKEANFLVPSVVEVEAEEEIGAPALNVARLVAHVHFRVKRRDGSADPQAAYQFYYDHRNPEQLIEDVVYRTLCRIGASQNFLEWIHVNRGAVSREFSRRFQRALDNHRVGVEVVYAGIPAVHPPAETAEAYESVISAYEEQQTMIYEAETEAVEALEAARGNAAQVLSEARSYRYRLREVSEAQRDRFVVQRNAFDKAPNVYRYRKYFSAIERVLEGHRLFIVPISEKEVNIIDTKKKLGSDILDINMEESLR